MYKLKYLTISTILVMSLSLAGPSSGVSARPLANHGVSPTLGTAASFSVLAATAVTNVPTSVIAGDVGLSPAAGGNYSGLTPVEVAGTIYAVDSFGPDGLAGNNPGLLTTAQNDNTAAFGFLNQTCDTDTAAVVDLTTLSPLGPGVYCADAFLLSGNLTLSGSGVWIFKSRATLTTSANSSVTGGDPCNVWWRLESSSGDIGTGSQMIGNILALTSINMQAGATLNGRVLAQTGAVTLSQNTITGPVCAAPPVATSTPDDDDDNADNAVRSLPNTGGAPIRNEGFPWSLLIFAGFSVIALVLGIRAYRRTHLPKQ